MKVFVLVVWLCVACVKARVVVDTVYGPVEGHTVDLGDGSYVNSFLAIPYAKPPIGALRWQPPVEPDPWEMFVADELGPVCQQERNNVSLSLTHPQWDKYSEDCLHLNVYTPQDMRPESPYPVMVWVHGGALQNGGNIGYPGHFLAKRDIIVVVINYRLNIFGFASTEDDILPGNLGLQDQIHALKFVRDNIAGFGGDPQKVTIAGQSAGSSAVGFLVLSPLAEGLFHGAILQSGSELSISLANNTPLAWMRTIGAESGCDSEDPAQLVSCMKGIDAEALAEPSCMPVCYFLPVVDGAVVTAPPDEVRASGNFSRVPMISGVTTEEGALFILGIDDADPGLDREEFEFSLRQWSSLRTDDEELIEKVYQAMLVFYTPWPHINDRPANLRQYVNVIGDSMFGTTQDQTTKLQADYADTYSFVFGFRGDSLIQDIPEWQGVPHGLEFAYTFGFPFLRYSQAARNDSQIYELFNYSEQDDEYSIFMMELWTNFVKYGNPTPEAVSSPLGEVTWSKFTNKEVNYLYIGNEAVEMRERFRQKEYAFWREYIPYILDSKS